jgi:uncharacterized Ntn-hydrolase superfamily protein
VNARIIITLALVATPLLGQASRQPTRADSADAPGTGTFSILGYDPATGEIGAAVQSRVFSVGNGVLWAEAGVGAAATQAIVDVGYGPRAIKLLEQRLTPEQVVVRGRRQARQTVRRVGDCEEGCRRVAAQ